MSRVQCQLGGPIKCCKYHPSMAKAKGSHALLPSSSVLCGRSRVPPMQSHIALSKSSEQQPLVHPGTDSETTCYPPLSAYHPGGPFPQNTPTSHSTAQPSHPSQTSQSLPQISPLRIIQIVVLGCPILPGVATKRSRISSHTDFKKYGAAACDHLVHHSAR